MQNNSLSATLVSISVMLAVAAIIHKTKPPEMYVADHSRFMGMAESVVSPFSAILATGIFAYMMVLL